MHSSRMRTVRSLTVCRGEVLPSRGVLPSGGCFLPGRVLPTRGCFLLGGMLPSGGGASFWGMPPSRGVLLHWGRPPPVDRITDTSKNITLATLWPVNTNILCLQQTQFCVKVVLLKSNKNLFHTEELLSALLNSEKISSFGVQFSQFRQVDYKWSNFS